jgi:sulfite exporter TauE/SafE
MIESLLIVVGGLLGSGHCVGMCGGFVLTLGSQATNYRQNLVRQIVYAVGRVSVYILAGAFVGFGSWKLGQGVLSIVNLQACLSIFAGLLLILEGVFAAGLVRRPFVSHAGCPGASAFASMLHAPTWSAVFAAGLANGLLPCGLVYAYLALAASAGSLFHGAAVMGLFGLGTMPAMIVTGLAGSLLSLSWRHRIFRLAAWCMILTGMLSLWRGSVAFQGSSEQTPACPYCAPDYDRPISSQTD